MSCVDKLSGYFHSLQETSYVLDKWLVICYSVGMVTIFLVLYLVGWFRILMLPIRLWGEEPYYVGVIGFSLYLFLGLAIARYWF